MARTAYQLERDLDRLDAENQMLRAQLAARADLDAAFLRLWRTSRDLAFDSHVMDVQERVHAGDPTVFRDEAERIVAWVDQLEAAVAEGDPLVPRVEVFADG